MSEDALGMPVEVWNPHYSPKFDTYVLILCRDEMLKAVSTHVGSRVFGREQ